MTRKKGGERKSAVYSVFEEMPPSISLEREGDKRRVQRRERKGRESRKREKEAPRQFRREKCRLPG